MVIYTILKISHGTLRSIDLYQRQPCLGRITFPRFMSKCFIFKCVSVWGMKTANASPPFVLNYMHLDFTLFLKKYRVLPGCPRKILSDTAFMHLSASWRHHCLQREVAWAHCPDTCPHGTGRDQSPVVLFLLLAVRVQMCWKGIRGPFERECLDLPHILPHNRH